MASTSSIAPVGGTGQTGTIVGKNQEATCYVGNLEERVTDSILWELFVQVAPVVSLHIPRDRLNQTHSGYGFVELQSEADAEYASKILHGTKLYGKALKVNRASADKKNLDVGANLFIGNLDPLVDDVLLTETFKSFGNVISSKIAREGEAGSGASRGFGFVSFDSFEAADGAIEAMSGQFLCNRPITVSYAFKKDGKGERHGTAAERLLAAQAKKTGLVNQTPTHPQQQQQAGTPQFSGYRPANLMPPQGMPGMLPPGMMMPPPGQIGFAPPPMGFDPNYFAAMHQHMMMQQQGQIPQALQQQQQQQQPQQYQQQQPQNPYPYPYPAPYPYPYQYPPQQQPPQ